MNLEHDLRRAFRRKPAPPNLVDDVLSRLHQPRVLRASTLSTSQRVPKVQWLATAAAVVAMVIGGAQYYTHQQTIAEAERLQKEVRLALQIAGETIAFVQRKLEEAHR